MALRRDVGSPRYADQHALPALSSSWEAHVRHGSRTAPPEMSLLFLHTVGILPPPTIHPRPTHGRTSALQPTPVPHQQPVGELVDLAPGPHLTWHEAEERVIVQLTRIEPGLLGELVTGGLVQAVQDGGRGLDQHHI